MIVQWAIASLRAGWKKGVRTFAHAVCSICWCIHATQLLTPCSVFAGSQSLSHPPLRAPAQVLLKLLPPMAMPEHVSAPFVLTVLSALSAESPAAAAPLLTRLMSTPGPSGDIWAELLPLELRDTPESHSQNTKPPSGSWRTEKSTLNSAEPRAAATQKCVSNPESSPSLISQTCHEQIEGALFDKTASNISRLATSDRRIGQRQNRQLLERMFKLVRTQEVQRAHHDIFYASITAARSWAIALRPKMDAIARRLQEAQPEAELPTQTSLHQNAQVLAPAPRSYSFEMHCSKLSAKLREGERCAARSWRHILRSLEHETCLLLQPLVVLDTALASAAEVAAAMPANGASSPPAPRLSDLLSCGSIGSISVVSHLAQSVREVRYQHPLKLQHKHETFPHILVGTPVF